MQQVKNNSVVPVTVHVKGGKKGEPKFQTIQPGETSDCDLADPNSADITGKVAAGAIEISHRNAGPKLGE